MAASAGGRGRGHLTNALGGSVGLVCRGRRPGAVWCAVCAAAVVAALRAFAADDAPTLDPMQRAVVESLDIPRRTAPADLLEAAIRAADVEAADAAAGACGRLGAALAAAGDALPDLLADLGDACDDASLARLERTVATRDARAREVIGAIRDAAALRRRDPRRLAAAAAALGADTVRERRAAAESLARAGVDALPALVDAIGGRGGQRARDTALALVGDLGPAAREPLLAWLGSDDVEHWPAVIEALAATGPLGDDAAFLLAPATVADAPPAARAAALEALGLDHAPAPAAAAAGATARLDRLLSPEGLPEPDHLLLEPVREPAGAVTGSVERWLWNPQTRRIERRRLPPRAARAVAAAHLARDVAALGAREPEAVRLVLLSRVEDLLVAAGEPSTAVERIGLERLRAALAPPEGFAPEAAADILDLAVKRGMWEAADAAARVLAPPAGTEPDWPLPVAVRKALVRALAVPDPALQFAAARTLALAAGDPPWAGSSRVVEVLVHAATAAGGDLAVVAHPDAAVAAELASGLSRFGYRTVRVATGRDAVLAARASADTTLVILAARLARPTALETVGFLRHQGTGGEPPVLVVVDPLDDDGRGRFLQHVILTFRDEPCVAVVDRLDSFFAGTRDAATGQVVMPPRFHDALARCAGPAAVDPAVRAVAREARLDRALESLVLLARLGRRGQDVSAALDAALGALVDPELVDPAATLLGTIARPAAQRALAAEAARTDVSPAARELSVASLAASVQRFGLLLGRSDLETLIVNYTHDPDAAVRRASAAIIDVIKTPHPNPASAPLDVAPVRPR